MASGIVSTFKEEWKEEGCARYIHLIFFLNIFFPQQEPSPQQTPAYISLVEPSLTRKLEYFIRESLVAQK